MSRFLLLALLSMASLVAMDGGNRKFPAKESARLTPLQLAELELKVRQLEVEFKLFDQELQEFLFAQSLKKREQFRRYH